jgi:hypothetical protein
MRARIMMFLVFAVILWAALLLIRGTPVTLEHLWPFGTVAAVMALLYSWFERYGWRLPLLRGFVNRPDISGTWKVILRSEWIDPKTGEPPAPIICFMAVRQTLSSLSMRLMTKESSSWLVAHSIFRSDDDIYRVATVYMNEPRLDLRGDRSEIHYGAFLLRLVGSPVAKLEGHYWTDRHTRGSLVLTDRIADLLETYDVALRAFEESPLA